MIFIFLILLLVSDAVRSFANDVICFFVHYLNADIHIYQTEKNYVVKIESIYIF